MAPAGLLTDRPRRLGWLIALALLASMVGAGRLAAEDEDGPLRVSGGPYRGTVLDGQTGRPLASAAVVILWQRLDEQIEGLRRLSAAREAFTDENGEFVHDVAALERRLPPRTLAPRILIYRPGYEALPSTPQLFPPGAPASRFAAPGGLVRLAPVGDDEDRAEALNTFVGMLNAAQLFLSPDLPETGNLIRSELQALGAPRPRGARPGGRR
jgi:hypothetical protein